MIISLPKKGSLKQCLDYRNISLISHPSKILFQVNLNRLKAKAEELLAEEQASFRSGWSTEDFIDIKKAFDRVWHAGLWQVLRSFIMKEGLVQAIQAQ